MLSIHYQLNYAYKRSFRAEKKNKKKLTKLKNKQTKQIIEWPMPVRMDI